jgi:hypothetical protein
MSENEKGWEQDTSTNLPIRVSAMWQHPPTRTFLSFLRSRFLNNLRVFNGCKRAPWPASSFYCLDSSKENSAKLAESFPLGQNHSFSLWQNEQAGKSGAGTCEKTRPAGCLAGLSPLCSASNLANLEIRCSLRKRGGWHGRKIAERTWAAHAPTSNQPRSAMR